MLFEGRGKIVSREAIVARLWPDKAPTESAPKIKLKIANLKRALGDTLRLPQYIERIGKEGYVFIADFEISDRPVKVKLQEVRTKAMTKRRYTEAPVLPDPGRQKIQLSLPSMAELILSGSFLGAGVISAWMHGIARDNLKAAVLAILIVPSISLCLACAALKRMRDAASSQS